MNKWLNEECEDVEYFRNQLMNPISFPNIYGKSIVEKSLKAAKQLELIEDAMVGYKLIRAPERKRKGT